MVLTNIDPKTQEITLTIRPNSSLGWKQIKWVFFLISSCLLAFTGYFLAKGAWLVLPFAGLEILVLGAGLYSSALRSADREIISIDERAVVLYKGVGKMQEVGRFNRLWARVRLIQDPTGWYPSRLYIGAHGFSVEIGKQLIEAERIQLAEDLIETLRIQPTCQKTLLTQRLTDFKTAGQEL